MRWQWNARSTEDDLVTGSPEWYIYGSGGWEKAHANQPQGSEATRLVPGGVSGPHPEPSYEPELIGTRVWIRGGPAQPRHPQEEADSISKGAESDRSLAERRAGVIYPKRNSQPRPGTT